MAAARGAATGATVPTAAALRAHRARSRTSRSRMGERVTAVRLGARLPGMLGRAAVGASHGDPIAGRVVARAIERAWGGTADVDDPAPMGREPCRATARPLASLAPSMAGSQRRTTAAPGRAPSESYGPNARLARLAPASARPGFLPVRSARRVARRHGGSMVLRGRCRAGIRDGTAER